MAISWPKNLSSKERFELARDLGSKLIDRSIELINLHEANQIILYSSKLSTQIPPSFAAHSFMQFRSVSLRYEVARLCAVWDKAEDNQGSIPTIVNLLADPDVEALVQASIRRSWSTAGKQNDFEQARESQGQAIFAKAVRVATAISGSQRLVALRNFRDKYIAHNLTQTRREAKGVIVPTPMPKSEGAVLCASVAISGALHSALSGASFDFDDSRRQARRNAKHLWDNCTFSVPTGHQAHPSPDSP